MIKFYIKYYLTNEHMIMDVQHHVSKSIAEKHIEDVIKNNDVIKVVDGNTVKNIIKEHIIYYEVIMAR